jgi:glycosyltransferase involved in cell wall biosynthesis
MISVVIPTYNNASYITEALDSVFSQSFQDYEVIVVDDGSTDNTRTVLDRYGSRVRYFFQKNQGLAVARNTGLGLASRDYVTYLDADDIWHEHNLSVKADILRAHPDLGGVFSEFLIFDSGGVRHERGTRHLFPFFERTGRRFSDVFEEQSTVVLPGGREASVYLGRVFESLFWGNFILPTSMVFNRARAQQVGEFLPELRTQQDYEYWLRFTKHHKLAFVDEVLVQYRRHASQLTDHSRIENIFLAVHRIIDQYEDEFSQTGRQRVYARRKAGLQTELAKVYLSQGRVSEARARLADSIRRDRTYFPAYAGLAVSVLPHRLISWARGRV